MAEPTAEGWARLELDKGHRVEEVASQLIRLGAGPIETLKALRATTGMGLGDLKPIVDAVLPPGWQASNERLRDELAAIFEDARPHLVDSGPGKLANIVAFGDGPYPCPCCGYSTLPDRGGYDICPVCFWEDDGQDDHDAHVVRGGPNYELSLEEARSNFLRIGAFSERVRDLVRPPRPEEATH